MALKSITKKVLSYCEIPQELTEKHWISEHHCDAFVECHLDASTDLDELDMWILEHYPELKDEDSFFIHLDY